jgi:dTMP kinase
MAYQGYGSGIPKHKVTMLDNIVLGNLRPDLTFVIDIDPEVGLKNATRRGELSRFDAMKLDYHKRVNAGFREIATKKENRDRCVLIKYEDGEDVVFNKVREEFMHRLFRELES